MKKIFGQHYLVDFIGCRHAKEMMFVKDLKKLFLTATKASQATILKTYFYQFKPCGVSGVVLIAESHLSVHTWPQDRYVSIDIQTCGKMSALKAIAVLKKGFAAEKMVIKILKRGIP